MRRLNRDWMGKDRPTDVLSFPTGDPLPEPSEEVSPVGEIVICVPVCSASSGDREVALHLEVARVMIHGTLHLLGYDHETAHERQEMRRLESRYNRWYQRMGLRVVEER